VLLVRHGQTTANADGIIQGWIDFPLTDLGRRQVMATAEALRDGRRSRCYTSPLGRALTTAGILSEALAAGDVRPLPGMVEVHAGAATGRTWAEVAEVHPAAWADFQAALQARPRSLAKEHIPGWEPVAHLTYRTWHALGAVLGADGCERAVIVSHGDTIDCLLSQVLAGSGLTGGWHYAQPNCAVSRLVVTDGRLSLPDGVQVLHGQAVT
jgi:probable phosphoglycerate mutase